MARHQLTHLAQLLATCAVPPVVNQVECHPALQQRELRAACAAAGVAVVAYSPLGAGQLLAHPVVAEVAARTGRTPAQVLLLDCCGLIAVDATGLEALEEAHTRLARSGCTLVLAGLRRQPHTALSNAGLLDRVGFANVVHDEVDGAARVSALLSSSTKDTKMLAA